MQRVKQAKVSVGNKQVGSIGGGLLLLVGIGKQDTNADIKYLANKIKNMRVFNDNNKKMNLDINQIKGEILSVPQFTLYADTLKGNRPGFDEAASPDVAEKMWKEFNGLLRSEGISVKEGQFAAKMQVQLVNDGPVTIWLDSSKSPNGL